MYDSARNEPGKFNQYPRPVGRKTRKGGIVKGKQLIAHVALLTALTLVVAACGTGGDGGQTAKAGGILRMETDGFEWTNSFDPTGEYLGEAWGIYSNLLLRTLVGYRHVAGPRGNEIIPDMAENTGDVSEDGLTYTFKIKKGIKFSPPVNREVTSRDVAYAFERIGTASLAAQYGFYYDPLIEGLEEFKAGAASISGITTPDDQTITFKLKKKAGDFVNLLAMPAAAPIPEEVGKCFTKAGEYGRYLISSGPYMLQGSESLDITSCSTMKPISGFDPTSHLRIVRNPNYDADTDSKEARSNFIDGMTLELNTNTENIFARIEAGQADIDMASEPAELLQRYSADEALKDRLKVNPGDRTWYITMNLSEPPFDDLAVRRAANYVMDKEGLVRVWGGSIRGEIAEHIIPPDVLNGQLKAGEYDPYASEGHRGDEAKAKEEMKKSKYDTDKDGICDAPACKNVLHITRNTPPQKDLAPVMEESFRKIGITLKTQQNENSYPIIQEPAKKIPISSTPGWGKDYANASTFAVLFDSRSIIKNGNTNYSLVGLTRAKAAEIGADYVEGIPSVDSKIDECSAMTGDEQTTCWANLDKHLMENVVPWVPYLWATQTITISEAVTKFEYDQFCSCAALAHMAVDPSKQKTS